jgi:CrcB protein
VANYDYRALAAVFAGGVVGTLARGAVIGVMPAPDPAQWPWSTFTANLIGAFLIGNFTTRLLERLPVSSYRRPFLGTGVCGGLTTFSTLEVETLGMIEHHKYALALGYTVGSVTLGFLAVYLGTATVRRARVR